MKRILITEDDIDIHNLIKDILKKEKYDVISAYSVAEALLAIEENNIDLILLDLMLPELSGEELIKKIKEVPIIVISAKISPEAKVNALLNGANDYLTKPFNTNELLARIKVQLRIKKNNKGDVLSYKEMILDRKTHLLYIKNKKIYLTKIEFTILEQLLLNPMEIITKTKLVQLLNQTDNSNFSSYTQQCDENALKVHISNIRKKIRNITDCEYIESIWGIGFKLYE